MTHSIPKMQASTCVHCNSGIVRVPYAHQNGFALNVPTDWLGMADGAWHCPANHTGPHEPVEDARPLLLTPRKFKAQTG